MYEINLDHEILKIIEMQPDIKEQDIASKLSVSEDIIKARIRNLKDTREKILIMGDGHSIHDNIKTTLEAENYNVVKASAGFSALEAVRSEKPDVVLLDTGLADVYGFQICKQLKTSSRYWWIPVVMLSEKGGAQNRIEAFESGVDDYFTLPCNYLELKARLRVILKRTRM
jgi:two-component system, OmpR family, alkaline phosphatase synthesis response regulator PhoP